MTKDILLKQKVRSIAKNLDGIQSHLRITHELLIEQLSHAEYAYMETAVTMNERIEFLSGCNQKKLDEMNLIVGSLREALMAAHNEDDDEIPF